MFLKMSSPKCFPHSLSTFEFKSPSSEELEAVTTEVSWSVLLTRVACFSGHLRYNTVFPHTSSTSSNAPVPVLSLKSKGYGNVPI